MRTVVIILLLIITSGCSNSFWHPDHRIRMPIRLESKEAFFDPNNPDHFHFLELLHQKWLKKNEAAMSHL